MKGLAVTGKCAVGPPIEVAGKILELIVGQATRRGAALHNVESPRTVEVGLIVQVKVKDVVCDIDQGHASGIRVAALGPWSLLCEHRETPISKDVVVEGIGLLAGGWPIGHPGGAG